MLTLFSYRSLIFFAFSSSESNLVDGIHQQTGILNRAHSVCHSVIEFSDCQIDLSELLL